MNTKLTWSGAMPMLLEVLERGNAKGRAEAKAELLELARLLDELIALSDRDKPGQAAP